MALGLLWLCLILPWALKTQAQNSKVRSRPSLRRAPLQPNFQADQFQGEWNAIGWAQNTFVSESISDVNMVSTKFELNKDHSYSVTSVWFSNQGCTSYVDTFVPTKLLGLYVLKNVTGYKGLQKFKMKVVETDYQQYAVVFYRALVNNKVYIECLLYGRNRNINPDLLSHFTHLARSMGFRPRYINFTILKTGCNIDYVEEPEILGPFT